MSSAITQEYAIAVVDIGSPKQGNIGWCLRDAGTGATQSGVHLEDLVPLLATQLPHRGLVLGLEAPLFVPLRDDLMLATNGRLGERSRPWSAGAGAQVLAINLPIMTYLFRHIRAVMPTVDMLVNEDHFTAAPNQIMVFEALVSGADKGVSHMDDAQIMVDYITPFATKRALPESILRHEQGVAYFNLTASCLLRCGMIDDVQVLQSASPIYKPSMAV